MTFVRSGPPHLGAERTGDRARLAHGEARAAAIPGAHLEVIPGMGHVFFSPGLPEHLADLIAGSSPAGL